MTSRAPSGPRWLALDIGGTKADVAVVSAGGVIERRGRVPVSGNAEVAAELVERAREISRGLSVEGVGVACAGPVFDRGRVSPLNIPQWRDFPLRDVLEEALQMPVRVEGDVRALALAEQHFGGAREINNFASLVVSTGIGGAVVMDGRLLDGRTGNAGHLGHVIVVPGGHLCSCGARGCLEAEASGWAIERDTGDSPVHADLDVRERVAALVGLGVGQMLAVLDIPTCFVSGSVALGFGEDFFRAANLAAAEVARLSYCGRVELVPSALGADGPILGAACVGGAS